ncbi:hypothetical protein BDF19DRAFT_182125 [Syncephalis fuscata]|nr:hypothetical protein BDF19DRAFT_182125 [Syncephalis fuscata]
MITKRSLRQRDTKQENDSNISSIPTSSRTRRLVGITTQTASPHFTTPSKSASSATKKTLKQKGVKRKLPKTIPGVDKSNKRAKHDANSRRVMESPATKVNEANDEESNSEDEEEESWEEVAILADKSAPVDQTAIATSEIEETNNDDTTESPYKTIEVTLNNMPVMRERVLGVTKQERNARVAVHHIHLLCLLVHWLRRHRRVHHPLIRASSIYQ